MRSYLLLFAFTIAKTIYGMESVYYHNLVAALTNGSPEQVANIIEKNFDQNLKINTMCGPMDPFAYLVLQTFPDKTTYQCSEILLKAKVHIKIPSEKTHYFTVFHFIKSYNMLDYFIKKANVENEKSLLDTYDIDDKETLFVKLAIDLIPAKEIIKIYNTYKPNLNATITAEGTILHHLVGSYLFSHLNAQLYHALPVQRIHDIVSEGLFRCAISYNYVDETYNKFKFFVQNGNIHPHKRNMYNQTPYEFYIFLLNGLQKNNLLLFTPLYQEYESLMKILFNTKIECEKRNINLNKFFEESIKLLELLNQFLIS